MPARIRLIIELDGTSPYVQGSHYEQMTYALAQLTRLITSDELTDLPELYPDLPAATGWSSRPVQVQTSREGLVTIGSFEVTVVPTLPEAVEALTTRLSTPKEA